jgi:hypothetical protein
MCGLLLKDFYVLVRHLYIMLIFIVILTLLLGSTMGAFAIFYTSTMPITALAYDEQSKWGNFAVMMPYFAKDIVLSKYFLGYILSGAATILSVLSALAWRMLSVSTAGIDEIMFGLLVSFGAANVFMSFILPFFFAFGVEKARRLYVIFCALIFAGCAFLAKYGSLPDLSLDYHGILPIALALIVLIAINLLSMAFSVKIYQLKNR